MNNLALNCDIRHVWWFLFKMWSDKLKKPYNSGGRWVGSLIFSTTRYSYSANAACETNIFWIFLYMNMNMDQSCNWQTRLGLSVFCTTLKRGWWLKRSSGGCPLWRTRNQPKCCRPCALEAIVILWVCGSYVACPRPKRHTVRNEFTRKEKTSCQTKEMVDSVRAIFFLQALEEARTSGLSLSGEVLSQSCLNARPCGQSIASLVCPNFYWCLLIWGHLCRQVILNFSLISQFFL